MNEIFSPTSDMLYFERMMGWKCKKGITIVYYCKSNDQVIRGQEGVKRSQTAPILFFYYDEHRTCEHLVKYGKSKVVSP